MMSSDGERRLYIRTPLIHSKTLSDIISEKVFLKLENVQPSNSFKFRGISRLCLKKLNEGYKGFVTFSGGNAGLALALTCNMINQPCHIFVPSFVAPRMMVKMEALGAEVQVSGTGKESFDAALELTKKDPTLALIHPCDHPELWSGYSTMVQEIKDDLPAGTKPSCLVCSVGGGGMLTGLLEGLKHLDWQDVPVVAVETIGAHSLNKSLAAGKSIENVPMTSVAKTLGAPFINQTLLDIIPNYRVISTTLTDAQAVDACLKFADHHTFLVEPSCGVSLATVYYDVLAELLRTNGFDISSGPVIIIVCGGSDTSPEILIDLAKTLGTME